NGSGDRRQALMDALAELPHLDQRTVTLAIFAVPGGGAVPDHPNGRFHGVGLAELRARPKPFYIVDRLLQADTVALLEGVDGAYKTFLAVAWALCVALGRPWLGRPVKMGRVLYLLGEGSS